MDAEEMSPLMELLFSRALTIARSSDGRYRAEEVLSAIAAFAGECQMRRAGDLDFNANFIPGQAIFSQHINGVLSGDQFDWSLAPITSAFGTLYRFLIRFPQRSWAPELFPNIRDVYAAYAEGVATRTKSSSEWGFVPLSLPARHHPAFPPLRAAFELRKLIPKETSLDPLYAEKLSGVSLLALIKGLNSVRGSIDDRIALTLALETLNAMAKTGPFLDKHAAEVAAEQRE